MCNVVLSVWLVCVASGQENRLAKDVIKLFDEYKWKNVHIDSIPEYSLWIHPKYPNDTLTTDEYMKKYGGIIMGFGTYPEDLELEKQEKKKMPKQIIVWSYKIVPNKTSFDGFIEFVRRKATSN